MPSLNKWSVIGNLGRDAELRYTAAGQPQLSFSVAISRRVKGDNEYHEVTDWVPVIWFGERGEKIAAFLLKGTQVYVEGRHQVRTWTDDKGNHEKAELIASDVQLLTSRGSNPVAQGESPGADAAGYAVNTLRDAGQTSLDDMERLPF